MNYSKLFLTVILLCTSWALFAQENAVEGGDTLETITNEVNHKILVVCYSRTGNTRKVSEMLKMHFVADLEIVVDKKDRSGVTGYIGGGKDAMMGNTTEIEEIQYNPGDYDMIIVGTPIWSWDMTPAIRTYLLAIKDQLADKKVVFFTTSGGTGPEKIVKNMEEVSGAKSLCLEGFYEKEMDDAQVLEAKLNKFAEKIETYLK